MTDSESPDSTYAIEQEAQYVPIDVLGDQWVGMHRDREALLMCHASRPLGSLYPDVTRLFFVIHGALRNSNVYLNHARHAVELSGVTASTLTVAPQFLADVDARPERPLPAGALYWDVESWKGGSPAIGPVPVSSFAAMDMLLRHITQSAWPDTTSIDTTSKTNDTGVNRTIVIAGNSAGGQFVNRYAAVGLEPRSLADSGFTVRFLISNPSSYLYFSADRPVAVAASDEVNRWRFGFENPVPYVTGTSQEYLRQYLGREVALVLGEEDRNPADLLLGISPPHMAQGANRFERGINYYRHVQKMAAMMGVVPPHRLITVPGIGHDAGDVLAAAPTRSALFA